MKAFLAFTKKEFMESWRTYRMIVLAAVFFLLGIMSPLFAKLMPELLKGMTFEGGLMITMPEPTVMDSWMQFFGNVGQMGMLTLIITFCGIMANELNRGTLTNLLTKGMKRHIVILSKFLSASILWTLSYLLCLGVCFIYTEYFWPASSLSNAFLSFFAPWLFGEFLITLLILGGVAFASFYGSLLTCGGILIVLALLNIAPMLQKYNPLSLATGTRNLLNAQKETSDFIPAIIICTVTLVLLLIASIGIFNKKRV